MKIQNNCYVNFGSKRLYQAKLEQPGIFKNKYTDVYLSELDRTDLKRMEALQDYWRDTSFGETIIRDFVKNFTYNLGKISKFKKYYIIETPNYNSENHVKALAEAKIFKDEIHVPMLQTEKEIFKNKSIKGGGGCMLFVIMQLARQQHKNSVTLVPTSGAESFYEHYGFTPVYPGEFEYILPKKNFSRIENRLKEKYSIRPVK